MGNKYTEEIFNDLITKLFVYDYDGTLINTPLPEDGKPMWEKFHGKEYPHVGWWSKIESMDMDVFEMVTLPEALGFYKISKAMDDAANIMMTGRRETTVLMDRCKEILDSHGFEFDQYRYNYGGETCENKISQLTKVLVANPNIVEVTLYDDRLSHEQTFRDWGASLLESGRLTEFTFVLITSNNH